MKGTDLGGEEPESRAEAVAVVQVADGVAWTRAAVVGTERGR